MYHVSKEQLLIVSLVVKEYLLKHRKASKYYETDCRLHFQISPNSLKSLEIGIFEVTMISFY